MNIKSIFLYLGLLFSIISHRIFFNESLHFFPLFLRFTLIDIGKHDYLRWALIAFVWYFIFGLLLLKNKPKNIHYYIFMGLAIFGIVTQIFRWNFYFQGLNQGKDYIFGIPLFFYGLYLYKSSTTK